MKFSMVRYRIAGYSIVQCDGYIKMYWDALEYDALRCSVMRFSAMVCSMVCSAV